ncbi:hypothetical protein, partial [Bradyrhizobium betae]|uniref:hypothetical protein n=1 Tax=Bradyrhizobium betae TaxID=244734 RepID=UPI0019D70CD0
EPSQDGQADPNAHLGVETAKAIGPHRADANTSDYCFPFSTESAQSRTGGMSVSMSPSESKPDATSL